MHAKHAYIIQGKDKKGDQVQQLEKATLRDIWSPEALEAMDEKLESSNLDPDALGPYSIPEVPERLTTLPMDIHEMSFDVNGKSISPITDVAFFNTGVTYENLGYNDYAVTAYTEAIRIDPQDPLSYQYRGDAYKALGKSSEAEADYEKAKNLKGK